MTSHNQIDRAECDPGTVARAGSCKPASPQPIEPARLTALSQEPRAQTAAGATVTAPAAFYPGGIALRLLQFVTGYIEHHGGISPSYADCTAIGSPFKGKSAVAYVLERLVRRGHVRQLRGKARALEVLTHVAIPRAPDGAPLYFVKVD